MANTLQNLDQSRIVVEVPDLAASNKKSVIRVLHVDDDPSMQELTKLMLLDLDSSFEIDNACCVDEAFGKLAAGNYDVVVSDYEMPQKDGLQFLTDLRKQNIKIPFVLFTGKGREEVAIKALNLGADAYCNKQGDPETVYGELSHGIKRSVEHQKAKKQLQDQTNLLVKIAAQTPGMLFQLMRQPNGTYCIPYTSEAIRNIFGCSPQEVREDFSPIVKVIVPKDMEKVIQSIEYSAKHLTPWQCEYRVQIPGQQIRWLWGQSIPEKLDDGSIVWNGYNTDVTEQKRTAETLADSEAKYRALIENADDSILLTDLRGKNIYRNRAHFKSLGFEEGDEAKIEELMKVHPDDVPLLKQKMSELFQTGYLTSEYRIKNSKGSWAYRHAKSTIIYNIHHQPYAIITIIRDITERKNLEKQLASEHALILEVVNSTDSLIFSVDKNYCYNSFNHAHASVMKEIYGTNIQIGESILDHITVIADREKAKQNIDKSLAGEQLVEEAFSGDEQLSRNYFIISHNPIRDGKGDVTGVVVVSNDITERKKADQKIREETVLRNTLLDNIACTALVLEKKTRKIVASNKIARESGAVPGAICYKICANRTVPCTFCLAPKLWATNETQTLEVEYEGKHYKGIWLPYNEDLYVHYIFDITDAKKAEIALKTSLHEMEILTEKLHVVGGLTRHDVGNKLMVIKSNIYLLKKQIGDNPKLAKYFEGIDSAINQSDDLFEFSRFYEKIGIEEPLEIDVVECFNQAVALLPDLRIVKIINDCQGLRVMADSLLKQLFYNFLDNSLKYGEKVTQIRLHFTEEGDGVKLCYEDDGVGILEANKPNLFHEGFTTGKSTGLGLFLVKKMVEVYGWTISEEGEPGKGAKFVITILKVNQNRK